MRCKHSANHHMRESKNKTFLGFEFNRRKRIEEEILVYEAAVPVNNTK